MKITPLKIILLSPLFNYSRITNEGCITSDFVGDLALSYAVNRVLKERNFYEEFKAKPTYEELRSLDYYLTVGKPNPEKFRMTGIYIRNTMFSADGYPDMDVLSGEGRFPTGKTLFKNYFKVQGIKPEAEFSSFLICKDRFQLGLPFTIRLGTGRECLALLDEDVTPPREAWLNIFSLKTVYGEDTVKKAIQVLTSSKQPYRVEFRLENYILLKRVNMPNLQEIFKGIF